MTALMHTAMYASPWIWVVVSVYARTVMKWILVGEGGRMWLKKVKSQSSRLPFFCGSGSPRVAQTPQPLQPLILASTTGNSKQGFGKSSAKQQGYERIASTDAL